jgi:hypothetical protein
MKPLSSRMIRTFWAAQPFGVSGGFNTAIGHLVP